MLGTARPAALWASSTRSVMNVASPESHTDTRGNLNHHKGHKRTRRFFWSIIPSQPNLWTSHLWLRGTPSELCLGGLLLKPVPSLLLLPPTSVPAAPPADRSSSIPG